VSIAAYAQHSALNPNKNLTQYVLRNWNTEHGLQSESANEILQSPEGYIWIGTFTGLHRFDGKDFTVSPKKIATCPHQTF